MRHTRPLLITALAIAAALAPLATSNAQEVLQGSVFDASTGEPLIGAQVAIEGTDSGAITDVDGRYRLQLHPGSYDLRVVYLGYRDKIVEGVTVEPAGVTFQDVALEPDVIQTEEIEVVISAEAERGSIIGALARQRRSTNVVNGISAEEIAGAPASNAADAIKRVSSTSLVDNRYVYVRGLGERYSVSQVDGSTLPTPEPEKRVLPLDIFPANMVESLFTVKSYTADLPGDFAGGLIDIQTKDIPEYGFFTFSTGVGYNSNLSDMNRLDYEGSDLDWLGFDNGARLLPKGFPDRIPPSATDGERADLHSRFDGDFVLSSESIGFGDVNKSFSMSTGSPVNWFGKEGGYLLGVNYSISTNAREQEEFFPTLEEGRDQYDFDTTIGTREVSWGAIGSYSINTSPTSRLSFKTMVTHSGDDEARFVEGPFDQSTSGFGQITRFQFIERTLVNTKTTYEQKSGWLGDSKLTWDGSYALAQREEPDTRQTSFVATEEGGEFFFNEAGNNSRFFSNLTDHMFQGGIKSESQFDLFGDRAVLDTGVRGGYRTRDFEARRFAYEGARSSVRSLPPTELFTSDNIRTGNIEFLDVTEPNDEYDATELTAAGYGSLRLGLSSTVALTSGLRVEYNDTDVESFDPRTATKITALSADLTTWEFLPSVAMQWDATPQQTVRAGVARTIVRPQFRELAPFRYDNYLESTLGNPFLENGEIYNIDARWSWYPTLGEVLSFGAFYKIFNDPIEIVRLPTGGASLGTPEPYNGPSAETYGFEIELRNDLGRWTPLTGLGITANLTIAESNVDQDEPVEVFSGGSSSDTATILDPAVFTNASRPMVNQSDFLINASLNYATPGGRSEVTLLYNGVGERLSQVGVQGFDDIFEQTRHVFDLTFEQRINGAFNLKFALANLTDEPYEFKIGDDTTEKYKSGREGSVKISYSF